MRNQKVSSSEKVQDQIKKGMESEWKTSQLMVLDNDAKKPSWFRAEPMENESFSVLDDPLVKEMLSVFSTIWSGTNIDSRNV